MNQELSLKMFAKVAEERLRQDEMWGEQNHEDGYWYSILGEEFGEVGTALCHRYYATKNLDPDMQIPDEELQEELIQVAAVCVSWLEALERRKTEKAPEVTNETPPETTGIVSM